MHWKFATVVAVALGLGFASAASAADMPVKAPPVVAPAYNWTGFYVGINGGVGWGTTSQTDAIGTTSGSYSQSGALVGGTVGFNYQFARSWVLGAEADWDFANVDGTVASGVCGGGTCFTDMKSFGTFRGRLGYAWDRWLVYATGGLAWANVEAGQNSCAPGANECGTQNPFGWTAGGGVEVFVFPKWSVKAEYLYADLGNHQYFNPGTPVNATEKVNIFRAGVNFHF